MNEADNSHKSDFNLTLSQKHVRNVEKSTSVIVF